MTSLLSNRVDLSDLNLITKFSSSEKDDTYDIAQENPITAIKICLHTMESDQRRMRAAVMQATNKTARPFTFEQASNIEFFGQEGSEDENEDDRPQRLQPRYCRNTAKNNCKECTAICSMSIEGNFWLFQKYF